MIKIKFINHIAEKLKIERIDLIEKDVLLQMILLELVKNRNFKENYAFKGGTCLIKCYFGYFRFSEDLDFTYLGQEEFNGKSKKKIREMISSKINDLGKLIEETSSNLGLDFKLEKENKNYFQYGGSNVFVTFKIWYDSAVLNKQSFIKVQINLIEKLSYNVKEIPMIFILGEKDKKEIDVLFKDYLYLLNYANIKAYDLRDILIEKVRAILTRRGIKARDFVDVFLIARKEKLDLNDFKKQIIKRIEHMLRFEKYGENIRNKKEQLSENLILGSEEALLLVPIEKGFPKFVKEFNMFLIEIINELEV